MKKPVWIALVILAVMVSGVAITQGDGHEQAHAAAVEDATELETSMRAFEVADAELNTVYQRVRGAAPEALFMLLRDTQRDWLAGRDLRAEGYASFNSDWSESQDAPEAWPEFWQARIFLTRDRTGYLLGWAHAFEGAFDSAGPWEGHWTDGYAGTMRIVDLGSGILAIKLEVVRGASFHTGDFHAFGYATGPEAVFLQPVPGSSEPAVIRLNRQGPVLELETAGPIHYFHGARAYFEGTYSRKELLAPAERQEVLDAAGL